MTDAITAYSVAVEPSASTRKRRTSLKTLVIANPRLVCAQAERAETKGCNGYADKVFPDFMPIWDGSARSNQNKAAASWNASVRCSEARGKLRDLADTYANYIKSAAGANDFILAAESAIRNDCGCGGYAIPKK